MSEQLSTTGGELRRWLDEAEVLEATVQQLRKDLNEPGLPLPEVGPHAFEELRAAVSGRMDAWQQGDPSAFSRAVNRVDLTERMVTGATGRGGLHELAGMMVLRCLQKVLLRKHFSR